MAQSDVTVLSEVHRTRASHRKQQSWAEYANDVLVETPRGGGITARLTEKWHDLSQERPRFGQGTSRRGDGTLAKVATGCLDRPSAFGEFGWAKAKETRTDGTRP